MIHVVCSVHDRAAQAFGRPFFVANQGLALRSFTDEVNRKAEDNQLFNHPDDFDLYELGTWDDSNGSYSACAEPKLLLLGKQAKNV